ncbi:MAG: 3-isopropylmalate dehydratase small subunit [Isosphaeraceae bacterium]
MEPFRKHTGRMAVIDWTDVNTDLIIPARYLKRIERVGYGPLLFADKRYVPGGAPLPDEPESHGDYEPDFPINRPEYVGATILVVGPNFGCGSSREHAVWAVQQAGYKAVIAPSPDEGFADIFEGNALNNGLLVVEIAESHWKKLVELGKNAPQTSITVDLEKQVVLYPAGSGEAEAGFNIPESARHRILNGLDTIGITIAENGPAIDIYEPGRAAWAVL